MVKWVTASKSESPERPKPCNSSFTKHTQRSKPQTKSSDFPLAWGPTSRFEKSPTYQHYPSKSGIDKASEEPTWACLRVYRWHFGTL